MAKKRDHNDKESKSNGDGRGRCGKADVPGQCARVSASSSRRSICKGCFKDPRKKDIAEMHV